MRQIILLMPVILPPSPAAAAGFEPIFGKWFRGDGIAKVEIYQCGKDICAKNFWIKPGHSGEKVGDILIMTLSNHKPRQFSGIAHDPQRNLQYQVSITPYGNTMNVKGCILGGVFCKNVKWSRL